MATKPIEIHPSAVAELKSAIAWYLERNETATIKFAAEVDRAVELVKASPRRWPKGDHGTRRFVLLRFPYAVIFREKESTVQILAIAGRDIGKIGCEAFLTHSRPGHFEPLI